MDYKVKSYVMLSIMFVLGFLAGMLVKDLVTESPIQQIRNLRGPGGFIGRLESDFDLTEKQKKEIKPILDKYDKNTREFIESGAEFFHTSMDSLKKELKPYLTEGQLEQLNEEFPPIPIRPGMIIEKLEKDLAITDKQKKDLKPIFEKYIRPFPANNQKQISFRSPFDSLKEKIKPFLTEEQIKKLDEIFEHPFPPGDRMIIRHR